MRDCDPSLETDIDEEATTLCRLWKVTRSDATIYRFTDGTADVTVPLDGTYVASISFTCSAIFTSSTLQNAQDLTMTFMLDDAGITEDDIRRKKFDGAQCEVMVVNYEDPSHGVMNLFRGTFGQVKLSDKHVATVNVTPLSSALLSRKLALDVYSMTCRASLGDAQCGFDIEAAKVAFTVDSLPTPTAVVASELSDADNSYAQGYVLWLTGDNEGTTSFILSSIMSSTTIGLSAAPAHPIQVGDTGYAYPGCDKTAKTCRDKFNRIAFLRAEPFVPGQDLLPPVRVATSGGGGSLI